jgi:lipid A 3-O-deacylase
MTDSARRAALSLSSFMIALFVTLLEPGCATSCAAEPAAPSAVVSQAATEATSSGAAAGTPDGSAKEAPLPNQYGMSVEYGYTYDPQQDISFLLARVFAIYDYGTVWHQDRPPALRFKVEGAAGSTLTPANDLIVSVNMLALYYLGNLGSKTPRPYVEGGIGAIYTQFRVKGQGLHYNFNPLLGVGYELPQEDGKNLFAAIRLHHISNAGFDHENRGVNSVELQIGRFF